VSDLEQRISRMLAANAAGVPSRTRTDPSDIGAEVRRRKVRRAGVAVLATAVVFGGGVRLLTSRSQDDQTMVVSQPTVTSTAPSPPSRAVDATSSVEMFVSGRLVRFAPAPVNHGTLPGAETLVQEPPVRTPFGVVALLGGSVSPPSVWLVPDGGQPVQLATSTSGVAVAAGGKRVAWSELLPPPGATSQLVVAGLPDGTRLASTRISGSAQVRGFAGDKVFVTTGVGAYTELWVWDPSTAQITQITGYRAVAVTDPTRAVAVLGGDGVCGTLVSIGSDRKIDSSTKLDGDCHQLGLAFSPDGTLLATVVSNSPTEHELAVLTTDGRERARANVGGRPVQAVWLPNGTLRVLTVGGSTYSVYDCTADAKCTLAFDVGPQSGFVWMVVPAT
jgi:hypothetical protein